MQYGKPLEHTDVALKKQPKTALVLYSQHTIGLQWSRESDGMSELIRSGFFVHQGTHRLPPIGNPPIYRHSA